jgi:hypothetical protein
LFLPAHDVNRCIENKDVAIVMIQILSVMLFRWVSVSRRCEGTYILKAVGIPQLLKKKAPYFFETSGNTNPAIQHQTPKSSTKPLRKPQILYSVNIVIANYR